MSKKRCFLILILFLVSLTATSQVRFVTELSNGWKFKKGHNDEAYQVEINDKNWENVSVPHDWAIYGPFDKEIYKQMVAIVQNGEEVPTEKTGRTGSLPYIGEGWYRNEFILPNYRPGQKVLIVFEGA